MSDVASLQAQLIEARSLLSLAEDVIIGLRCGVQIPTRPMEGIFGRENDKAGLRELRHGQEGRHRLGRMIWYEVR
jgi:hypothetical protein